MTQFAEFLQPDIVDHYEDMLPGVLQCVAVCCSMLQRGAVWCSVLQCVAVCNLLPNIVDHYADMLPSVLQCVAVCCSVLQCVAV